MKNHFLLLFLLMAVFATSCKSKKTGENPSESVDFNNSFSISSEFVDATSQFEITVHLTDPLHAYAPGEKIGKPIKLEITGLHGWVADGPLKIPQGRKKKIGALGEGVVLQGDVRLSQKLKKGDGKGEALLHLQVCTANACDRPRVHRLPIVAGAIITNQKSLH